MRDESYQARLAAEEGIYRDCVNVHDLPEIFHYWSNRHVRPKLNAFGFGSPNEMFQKYLEKQYHEPRTGARRFVSIGSGNCDLERELAVHLRAKGHADFVIDCLDLNPAMLERGRSAAAGAGVDGQMNFVQEDFNKWSPTHEYDAVIANQALHHVTNLEELFARIRSALKPHGTFVISDIIGRNGHQRWPQALKLVHEFWRKLPPTYRFNRELRRYEELYQNWDCSSESFEGIRSEDILRLLLGHFHFQLFIGFANVIDPFVDRAFGHNFDASAAWDRDFIDNVHRRDEEEIFAGHIPPTHMLAVVGNNPGLPTLFHKPLSPEFCLHLAGLLAREAARDAAVKVPQAQDTPQDSYEYSWPHSPQKELEWVCQRMRDSQDKVEELDAELRARTAWALQLDKDLEERTTQLQIRTTQLQKRTAEFEERTVWALQLDKELAERTQHFNQELDRLAWALPLDRRFHNFLDAAVRVGREFRARIRRMLFHRGAS